MHPLTKMFGLCISNGVQVVVATYLAFHPSTLHYLVVIALSAVVGFFGMAPVR